MLKLYNGENPPKPITRARHVVKLYQTGYSSSADEELAGMVAQEIADAVACERERCVKLVELEIESVQKQIEGGTDAPLYVMGWKDALERLKVKFND